MARRLFQYFRRANIFETQPKTLRKRTSAFKKRMRTLFSWYKCTGENTVEIKLHSVGEVISDLTVHPEDAAVRTDFYEGISDILDAQSSVGKSFADDYLPSPTKKHSMGKDPTCDPAETEDVLTDRSFKIPLSSRPLEAAGDREESNGNLKVSQDSVDDAVLLAADCGKTTQNPVCKRSNGRFGLPLVIIQIILAPTTDVSECWDVSEEPSGEISNSNVDHFDDTFGKLSDFSVDDSDDPFGEVSDASLDDFKNPIGEISDVTVNIHQNSIDVPQSLIQVPSTPVSDVFKSCEVFKVTFGEVSDTNVDIPENLIHVSKSLIQVGSPSVSERCGIPQDQGSDCSNEKIVSCLSERVHSLVPFFISSQDSASSAHDVINVNSCKYEIGRHLGKGGFGSVYEGIRLTDGLKVALKFAKNKNVEYMDVEGYSEAVPIEIALMILANKGPKVPQIIQLLDWQEKADHYIMVLERPMPCEDLVDFLIERHGGTIEEDLTVIIMRQVTIATQTCCQRGVLHRDIKLPNVLVNPDTLEVKLIDFGCGEVLTGLPYTSYAGTEDFCPPEFAITGEYYGEAATTWSLGILLFALLCGAFPEPKDLEDLNKHIWKKDGLSDDCCELLCSILQRDPKKRLELQKLHLHNWFQRFSFQKQGAEIINIKSFSYEVGAKLREETNGTVYAGIRLNDSLKVTLKLVQNVDKEYVSVDGFSEDLPQEIVMLILASKGPRVYQIIQLLDWLVEPKQYIIVLEDSTAYEDMTDFLDRHGGSIKEDVAAVIMQQATLAAQTCWKRGVLHGDIDLKNLLINPKTHEVRLTGFGCGEVLTSSPFPVYFAAKEDWPLENDMYVESHKEQAMSWSLGMVLFFMLCGSFPESEDLRMLDNTIWCKAGLSRECCELLCSLLRKDPMKRLELEKVHLHNWFQCTSTHQKKPEIIDINSCKYEIGRQIGEGGFGSVYEGIRLTDGLKVALKFAVNTDAEYLEVKGYFESVPTEIGLLLLANKGDKVPQIIQLLDWKEDIGQYIMVLEWPTPCENLKEFLKRHGGPIKEDVAAVIMQQVTFAVQTCCQRKVLHRDIKLENLLINTETFQVKLIDFGCGEVLTFLPYSSYHGTKMYCPPEYFTTFRYHGKPATTWSLGILLFALLCGRFPKLEDLEELNKHTWRKYDLSQDCCGLLCSLLQRDPAQRLDLDLVLQHIWFKSRKMQPL